MKNAIDVEWLKKMESFRMLADAGFGEIDMGEPAVSGEDYDYLRALMDHRMIPDHVTVRVVSQSEEKQILKTYEAIRGIPRAVIALHISITPSGISKLMKKLVEQAKEDGTVLTFACCRERAGEWERRNAWERSMQTIENDVNDILKKNYGIHLPEQMRDEVIVLMKGISEQTHKALTPDWIYQIFADHYVNAKSIFAIDECHFKQIDGIVADATIQHGNDSRVVTASGNGRLDAVSNAIKQYFDISYELRYYEEHSLTRGSSSKAVAYVGIICNGKACWGVGIDADIIKASIEALIVAVNKIDVIARTDTCKDPRMIEILNYIQTNYIDVTLEDLSEKFFLSKPYLSKYIKEKSGKTYGELVKKARMKKARTMLKTSNMTVENIALTVGYQNVEHFNRLFKKTYHMTPTQYRNQR